MSYQAIPDSNILAGAPADTAEALKLYRGVLQQANATLSERFSANVPVTQLVRQRSAMMDVLLTNAWRRFLTGEHDDIALVAVGGYGRGELHPGSDIDLLILLDSDCHDNYRTRLEKFLIFIWDIGLEIGHSVRSLDECVHEAAGDITIATNLMESRLLSGPPSLHEAMCRQTGPDRIWPSRQFFEAKWDEQIRRHLKYHDTGYNLEPNVKEGPGGLRDIQMIGWVAKRHFNAQTLEELIAHEFLTRNEYQQLASGEAFLWRVRTALHLLTGRREDRLLFDYQKPLATQFGYVDDDQHLAVEKLMKDYYRTITELSRLNEMLLQLFQEAILYEDGPVICRPINKRFQCCNDFIEVTAANIFRRYPFALLEIFLLLAQDPKIKGVRAATIRLIRDHRHLIDDDFRDDLRCRSLFIEILRQPQGVTHELRRMNRYGILAAYLPVFSHIVGQMQYDLFHVYTVDDHTLMVVRNLRRLTVTEFAREFPFCSELIKRIPKTELLYIAALFHDIAKGRGGDHSELGATEASHFCYQHGLSDYDTELVSWLVRNHLIMSETAQRKDISDPAVIAEFARHITESSRLDYLYLLTVADIRGTNPALWNNWKDTLLRDLYGATRRLLETGPENQPGRKEHIEEHRQLARTLLHGKITDSAIETLWRTLDDDYFLRHNGEEIAWQTSAITSCDPTTLPLVLVREETLRGGTEIFVYTHDQDYLFAIITAALEQSGVTIVDARIVTTDNGFAMDTFIVLDASGEVIRDPRRIHETESLLRQKLIEQDLSSLRVTRRPARQLKHFQCPTQVTFRDDKQQRYTLMDIITADRPGLLAQIGQALVSRGIRVKNAKIATFGARVEDSFIITDDNNAPLDSLQQRSELRTAIIKLLDSDDKH